MAAVRAVKWPRVRVMRPASVRARFRRTGQGPGDGGPAVSASNAMRSAVLSPFVSTGAIRADSSADTTA